MANPKYKRILLKLSGEALEATDGILDFGFSFGYTITQTCV